ncbi:MAG: glycosyltransferase family 4 protein [Pseudomonadales bacterium]|nr:glycosyltransferase family 4 protein [Pseudomonadales bacterium]
MQIENIILYSKRLPPEHIGGIETNAFYLIRFLLEQERFKVFVVSQGNAGFFKKHREMAFGDNKLDVYMVTKKQTKKLKTMQSAFGSSDFDPSRTLIYHNTLDLHPHYERFKKQGYRQVARSGGNDIFFHARNNKTERAAFLKHLNSLDRLILNSEYSLRRSVDCGLSEQKLAVIKGGCERGSVSENATPAIPETENLFSIICCGRLVDFKGLEDAIDAMKIVRDNGHEFRFYMVGDGPLEQSLQKRIEDYGLGDYCLFLGKQPPETIPGFYLASDIYLSSSKDIHKQGDGYTYVHTETMGRSICEAQVHGLPVVSTDAGGAPEMLWHEETGFVVPQGDAEAMASAIIKLISDADLMATFSENAAKYASNAFGWSKVIANTIQIVDSLAD